jgi:DNA repair protein RadC
LKHYDFSNVAVVLAGSKAAREFFEPIFTERDQELTLVAFCDLRMRLIQLICFPGTKDSCTVSVREIARYAVDCAGFIMAHNHPSGIPAPSDADIKLTRRLCNLAEALNVQLLDHLVLGGGNMTSFRQLGLL